MIYFENLVAIGVIAMTKKSMKTVVIKKRDRRGCECDSNLRGEKIRRQMWREKVQIEMRKKKGQTWVREGKFGPI